MKRLIVNADDFGLCDEVTRGIRETHRNGIVTSASMLVTTEGFETAAAAVKAEPALGVGLHLDLTLGDALSSEAAGTPLVDGNGRFCLTPVRLAASIYLGKIPAGVIRQEWKLQMERFLSMGLSPTHVDSEKHVHMIPALFPLAAEIAQHAGARAIRVVKDPDLWRFFSLFSLRSYKMAVLRQFSSGARLCALNAGLTAPDYCVGVAPDRLDHDLIYRVAARIADGTTELVCHPGHEGPALGTFGSLRYPRGERERQLEVLIDPAIREAVLQAGVSLVHYGVS